MDVISVLIAVAAFALLLALDRGAGSRMSGADLFGLIVSALVVRYLTLRAAARREALMLQGWLQIALFLAVLVALTPLLGGYMARVYTGERVFLTPVIGPLERLLYRALRRRPERVGRTGRPTPAACSCSPRCSGSRCT